MDLTEFSSIDCVIPEMDRTIAKCALATVFAAVLTITSSLAYPPHIPKSSHSISDNGRYRLDCVAAFGEGAVFKLTDLEEKRVLWSREEEPIEEAQAIHVHDDGTSVIENLACELVFTSPEGEITGKANIYRGFSPDERRTYVKSSSAGPVWSRELAVSYFLPIQGELYFVVRNWWGGRLVAEIDEGKFIAPTREIIATCDDREKKIALRILEQALSDYAIRENGFSPTLFSAVLMAGQLPCPEAAPILEKLQDFPTEGWGEGKAIDLTLRRLGKEPKRGVSRDKKLLSLKAGMRRTDVFRQIHLPYFGGESRIGH